MRKNIGGRVLVIANPDALAVVAAGGRLEHYRPAAAAASSAGELGDLRHAPDPAVTRAPDSQFLQRMQSTEPVAHGALILRETQRGPPWPHRSQVFERAQVIPRHVLVIERHHIAARAERQHVIGRSVVAGPGARADLRGAIVRRVGEHAKVDAERDRGLGRHPGELACANHPDDRPLAGPVSGLSRLRNAHCRSLRGHGA